MNNSILLSKKSLYIFTSLALAFIGYRAIQMREWLKSHPAGKGKDSLAFSVIRLRKLHVKYDSVSQPKEYIKPMIQSEGMAYNGKDTIYLNSKKRELVEFELIGNKDVTFNDVDLTVLENNRESNIKPHINKREDCYSLAGNKALFAFRPWIYTSDLNNLVKVKMDYDYNGNNSEAIFPIIVLDPKSYDNYISNRLTLRQKEDWIRLKSKYQQRLNNSWQMNKIGNGRRSYYSNQISVNKFFAGMKYHNGLFTNEYFARDGDFKITLYVDFSPSIVVEPISLML